VPLFSLLIGLALAFLVDGLDHTIKDATDAETNLGAPVLGSLSKTH
jgi:capsular polysaccharide biosynthesis protein